MTHASGVRAIARKRGIGHTGSMSGRPPSAGDFAHRQREQAAGFDAVGARYDQLFPHKDGQVRAGELLLDRLPTGARVLDVGCGTGLPTARQLVDGGCAVAGIDISPVMLEIARRNVPEATFEQRDAVDIEASGNPYDAVVAFFSLLMLPRREITRVLTRFREVLVPAGWVALSMVEGDIDDVAVPFLGVPVRVTGWPREQLRRVVTAAGFTIEIEDVRTYRSPSADVAPETQLFLIARRS